MNERTKSSSGKKGPRLNFLVILEGKVPVQFLLQYWNKICPLNFLSWKEPVPLNFHFLEMRNLFDFLLEKLSPF